MSVTRKVQAAAAAAAAAAIVSATGTSAVAASNHSISGTVYSPCSSAGHAWYTSSTPRYKEGYGNIKVIFSDLNRGGLYFKLRDANGLTIGYTQSWAFTETEIWKTLATSVSDGKRFYNSFKQISSSCGLGDYNFAGTEYY